MSKPRRRTRQTTGRVARLIDGLVDLVPTAIGAVTGIFATSLLGSAAGTLRNSPSIS